MTGIIAQNVGRTSGLIKAASGGGGGVWTKIKTLTASSDSTLSFVDGSDDVTLDSTYPIYLFKFINLHPSADAAQFMVGFRDGDTAYDAPKQTTYFKSYHAEDDAGSALVYETSNDMANSTSVAYLSSNVDNDNDAHLCGELYCFGLSNTTFVKHFMYTGVVLGATKYCYNDHVAGYVNVTAAIDGVQFTYDDGNIDSGKIKLYGLKDSA